MSLVGSSSTGAPTKYTKKWTEVAEELIEGEFLAEEIEKEVLAHDGGLTWGMEVGGCGSVLDSFVIENVDV